MVSTFDCLAQSVSTHIARAAEKLSLIPYETLLEQQKRKFPRYNVSLSVSVLSQNGMAEAQPAKIHNISMGGVFLEVDKITIATQDVLVVEILFKGKLHKIKVKKCWEKNLSVQRSLRGIGLQFDSLDAVTQSFVEEYIRETSQT